MVICGFNADSPRCDEYKHRASVQYQSWIYIAHKRKASNALLFNNDGISK